MTRAGHIRTLMLPDALVAIPVGIVIIELLVVQLAHSFQCTERQDRGRVEGSGDFKQTCVSPEENLVMVCNSLVFD